MVNIFASLTAISVPLLISKSILAATFYTITDLGELTLDNTGNSPDNQQLKIRLNNNNQVVGWERNSTNGFKGFVWDEVSGKSFPLSDVVPHKFTDINQTGQITGQLYDVSNNAQSQVWNFSFSTNIPTQTPNTESLGINDNNTIVGSYLNFSNESQAYFASEGIVTNISTAIEATAINNNTFISGQIFINDAHQAYIWDGANLTALDSVVATVNESWSSDINNLNQTVGGYQTVEVGGRGFPIYTHHGFVWDLTNGFTPLDISNDTVSWATAINDNGLIVGGGLINPSTPLNSRRAVLWENDIAYELNHLVSNLDNWNLEDATDININGVIVGIGKRDNITHAFLLTPEISNPASAELSITTIAIDSPIINAVHGAVSISNSQKLGLKVVNHGPDDATNIVIDLNSNLVEKINTVTSSKGSCSILSNTNLNCDVATLLNNEELLFEIDLKGEIDQTFEIEGSIRSDQVTPLTDTTKLFSEVISVKSGLVTVTPIDDSPTNQTPLADNSETTSVPAATSNRTTSSAGCSISHNTNIDLSFFILLTIACVGLIRKRYVV